MGEVADSYGDESCAKLSVDHKVPSDVTREQLEYYPWVYPFVRPTDLLFYLYPVAKEYEIDKSLECIDSLMYSLDREILTMMYNLTDKEQSALREGLNWIWETGGDDYADWFQCHNLQKIIGISL